MAEPASESPQAVDRHCRVDGEQMRFTRVGAKAGLGGSLGCVCLLAGGAAGAAIWAATESGVAAVIPGAVLALAGITLLGMERYSAWLDGASRELVERWRLFGWERVKRTPFDAIDGIDLETESDRDYEVEIGLTGGIKVYEGRDYDTARAVADRVAAFTGRPLRDQHKRTGPGFDA